jgi:choline-sulfatase
MEVLAEGQAHRWRQFRRKEVSMSGDNKEVHDRGPDGTESAPPESGQDSSISRRRLVQAGAVGAAAAAAVAGGLGGGSAFAQTVSRERSPSSAGAGGRKQPNILFFIVDEQRSPVVYESAQLAAWRGEFLNTQNALAATGVSFLHHSISSVACVPSRTSLFTGQYPSLHGNTQTDGGAKGPVESDMFWLDPNCVPTMGNWFEQAGYRTFYKGKWHLSHEDFAYPGTVKQIPSYDKNGFPDPAVTQIYLDADRLDLYGFHEWIGPDPHGANPRNSGSSAASGLPGRDVIFAQQAVQKIQELDKDRSDKRPWLMVTSFTDPHDIAIYGIIPWFINFINNTGITSDCDFSDSFSFENDLHVPAELFNPKLFRQTLTDNLRTKPSAQASAQKAYRKYMQGIFNIPKYQHYYYTLQERVDQTMGSVYRALKQSRFFDDTIVIFTSDHGDLLSSHHSMHQKWYTAYDEVVHVPLVISNPKMFPRPKAVDALTNHVDVLPTLLGLAGINQEAVRKQLEKTHTNAKPLIGRDLSKLVTGAVASSAVNDTVYYMTDDDMSRGSNQFNWIGFPYDSVVQPNHIETVITRINGDTWKYTRYFDAPQFWSTPGYPAIGCGKDDVVSQVGGHKPPGKYVVPVTQTVKNQPLSDQFEMYNITADPMELTNLAGNRKYAKVQNMLNDLLIAQSCAKRLQPIDYGTYGQGTKQGPVPGALKCRS